MKVLGHGARILQVDVCGVTCSKLLNNSQWDQKEVRILHKIKSFEDSLRASKLAKQRTEELLKKPGKFDPDAFIEMNLKFDHEITQFQLQLREAQEELDNLRQLREEEEKLIQFATDRRELLNQIRDILNNLPFKEKQRFIKGMLAFPIEIGIMQDLDWTEDPRGGAS